MKLFIALSTAVALAATGIYNILLVHNAVSLVSTQRIISDERIPESFDKSLASKITNPKNHPPNHDTRHLTIRVPKSLSDEEILARFVKGFFGGYVFGPERNILRATRIEITDFIALKDAPVSSRVWSPAELSSNEVPPLHTLLFGTFRVVDSRIQPRVSLQTSTQADSYIDFAFGSDDGFIAGVHRFSISRNSDSKEEIEDDGTTTSVTIEFSHKGCNPKEDKPMGPDFMQTLHLMYAMLLFREGVAEVIKAQ